MDLLLTKSDFKVAQNCLTKLWYKKKGYPSLTDGNEYMELLADGGFMIGKMAQVLYPQGILIPTDTQNALDETQNQLKNENAVLFEAAFLSRNKLVRVDILEKIGNQIRLIEVKSKSFRTTEGFKKRAEWREYLLDVAFQKLVVEESLPEAEIRCFLFLPDKDKATQIEGLISWFSIEESDGKTKVNFTGDQNELSKGHILSLVSVDKEIEELASTVKAESIRYVKALKAGIPEAFKSQIGIPCRDCEYRLKEDLDLNGFKDCWGKLAEPKPHILELGQIGNVNRKAGNQGGIDALIRSGKTSLSDVPVELLQNDDILKPYYNNRPFYQRTRKEEFLLPAYGEELRSLEYPLHFIDFETSQMAIPYHKGMRPYEKVMFQWSCHTITKPGAEPTHSEWINTKDSFPNQEFAMTLMAQLGHKGSIMTWSPYENSQFKVLKNELEERKDLGVEETKLLEWITATAENFKGDSTRIVDMNKLALKYYFHPLMGGRTSIKVTLPAVLAATQSKRIESWLREEDLFSRSGSGMIVNPYELLPSNDLLERAEKVKDGGGAMIAYQEMMFGVCSHKPDVKAAYRDALLKYCKLDTLAMVIIWEHWNTLKNKL